MAKFAIFGDNYVSRLQKFMNNDMQFPVSCRFFGVPGMNTRRKFQEEFERLLAFRPTAVFINIGGNDIDGSTSAAFIVEKIQEMAKHLEAAGVQHIFIASIIERGNVPDTTTQHFNQVRKAVNRKLRKIFGRAFFDVMKKLKFPRHYDRDLVHPGNQEGGMKILKCIIHRCLLSTLKQGST